MLLSRFGYMFCIAVMILSPGLACGQSTSVGIEAAASTPKELADAIRAEVTKLGKVIKDAGIREE